MSGKIKFRTGAKNSYSLDPGDVSNSEDEYSEEEKRLLEKVRKKRTVDNYDSEDEVYGLQDEDDDDEEDDDEGDDDSMKSDIEGLQEDDDLPDEKAWGKKKRVFYSTDYVDQDYGSTNQQDIEAAELEEQEARNIQKRLAEQLDDADFGLDLIGAGKEETKDVEDSQQLVKTDLSKLSKRQKQALMLKESPEFLGLVTDLKERLKEANEVLEPFLKLVKDNKFPDSHGLTFVSTKYQAILNYCTNILYYLMLKAERIPVRSHPVIKRLAQYRQLLNQLEEGQGTIIEEIVEILEAAKRNQPLYSLDDAEIRQNRKRQAASLSNGKIKQVKRSSEVEFEEPEDDKSDEDELAEAEDFEDENELDNKGAEVFADLVDEKRAITRQIEKNRGLTPYRKKELRNPRVKHRNKYRKAKIRRKGAVREVRKETTRYGGEMSGIKASVSKSIKLK